MNFVVKYVLRRLRGNLKVKGMDNKSYVYLQDDRAGSPPIPAIRSKLATENGEPSVIIIFML